MSRENTEIVEAIFRGWNEAGLDGMLPFLHRDIEYLPMEERGIIHGHDGLRRYFDRWMESWEELLVEPSELRAAAGRVFNAATVRGRGRGSGADVTMKYWQVWVIRAGRAVRWEEYLVREDALAAIEPPAR